MQLAERKQLAVRKQRRVERRLLAVSRQLGHKQQVDVRKRHMAVRRQRGHHMAGRHRRVGLGLGQQGLERNR